MPKGYWPNTLSKTDGHENSEEIRSSTKDLSGLQTAIYLAKKVGEGLGGAEVLLRKMSPK